ncbi:MAG: hypothetical protein R2828_13820 [Saprospiraceae bacterium]
MKFNSKVDLKTDIFVDIDFFNDNLRGKFDNIYVTFVAHPFEKETDIWEDRGDSFLWLVLPYEEVLKGNAVPMMTRAVFDHLPKLEWLEHEEVADYMRQRLGEAA